MHSVTPPRQFLLGTGEITGVTAKSTDGEHVGGGVADERGINNIAAAP